MQVTHVGPRPRIEFFKYEPFTDPYELTVVDFSLFEEKPALRSFVRRCFNFELAFAGLSTGLGSGKLYVYVRGCRDFVLRKLILRLPKEPMEGGELRDFEILGGFSETPIVAPDGRVLGTERRPI